MSQDDTELLRLNARRFFDSLKLVQASVEGTPPYDPSADYSPKELEPYDALSDRFVRSVETAIRFLRSYERFLEGEIGANLRDTLNSMEKRGIVTSTDMCMDMRDVRNRIVNDYAPEQMARLQADMRGPFFQELRHLRTEMSAVEVIDDA